MRFLYRRLLQRNHVPRYTPLYIFGLRPQSFFLHLKKKKAQRVNSGKSLLFTMGTRGLRIIRHRGRYYVYYNHFDSYPEGLGQVIVDAIPLDPQKYKR